jgi:HlyD family secretion protein
MDIQRKNPGRGKKIRRIVYILVTIAIVVPLTVIVVRLKPAAQVVDRGTLFIGEVKRGPMTRNVRGLGTLVPEEIHWIPATTQGTVEKIIAHPGDVVKSDTILIELSDPDSLQNLVQADTQLKAAQATYNNLKVQLQTQRLNEESVAAKVQSDFHQAEMQATADADLDDKGLVKHTQAQLSSMAAKNLETQNRIEQDKLQKMDASAKAQLDGQEAEVSRLQAMYNLKKSQVDSLHVRAGSNGVVQVVPVEVGARVQPGTNLARVTDPARLKAQIKIAETQIKDVMIGQTASIDTRNGIVEGKVSRIDPSSQNGTFTVDVSLTGELPKGAKDNLSVDGTVELEHMENVIYVSRPVHGTEQSTIGLFKLINGGTEAIKVQAKLGRTSVSDVEVLMGLQPGDQVILSDMSAYDAVDRLRIGG